MKKRQNKIKQIVDDVNGDVKVEINVEVNVDKIESNSEKEKLVKKQTRLKKVQQNKKLTGKSKEYINSLSQKGGIRKKRKNLNAKQSILNAINYDMAEERGENEKVKDDKLIQTTEIGDEQVIKDFEVILLKE